VGIFFVALLVSNLRAPRPSSARTDPATGETLA
jgi:hypothetical protein